MASQLIEAFQAQILGDIDPNAKAMRKYVDVTIKEKEQDLILLKAESIDMIASKLGTLPDDTPVSVKQAYEKLLGLAVGNV
jgi:hypothetical protein